MWLHDKVGSFLLAQRCTRYPTFCAVPIIILHLASEPHPFVYYTVLVNYDRRIAAQSVPIFMSNVQCSDVYGTLLDCSYSRNTSNTDHSKDVGIKCTKRKFLVK